MEEWKVAAGGNILILMCFNRDKDEDNAQAIPMATSHTKYFSVKCGDFY